MDPEDCIQAARYLARTGRVDGTRIVIRGKSAAGLTALSALIGSDTFAAGASYYGVIDIERLTWRRTNSKRATMTRSSDPIRR